MKLTITFILSLFLLSSHSQKRIVKKRTETVVSSTPFIYDGYNLSRTKISNYIKYDHNGNEIENGTYGESKTKVHTFENGRSMMTCSRDYSKINFVIFSTFDNNGKKIKDETWYYKNNLKNQLESYTIYKYNDFGFLLKEIHYSDLDTISYTVTYDYDRNQNNILIVDSFFNSRINSDSISISKTIRKFDSQKRVTVNLKYFGDKLWSRRKYIYQEKLGITTELSFDNLNDTSLIFVTDTKFGHIEECPYSKEKLAESYRSSKSKSRRGKIYYYNNDCLLVKIEEYNDDELIEYSVFDYEFY